MYKGGSTGTPKGVMEPAKHFEKEPNALVVGYRQVRIDLKN